MGPPETKAVQRPKTGPRAVSEVEVSATEPSEITGFTSALGAGLGFDNGKVAEGVTLASNPLWRKALKFSVVLRKNGTLGASAGFRGGAPVRDWGHQASALQVPAVTLWLWANTNSGSVADLNPQAKTRLIPDPPASSGDNCVRER